MNYTQFRLSNGDEIVAQVVQEPEGEEINLVIRNAMMVIRTENLAEGFRYYSFRPWMSFQLNDEYMQLLNYSHIVGEAKPDKVLLDQYKRAINNEKDDPDRAEETDSDEIRNLRQMIANMRRAYEDDNDSDSGNVIPLFDRGKLH